MVQVLCFVHLQRTFLTFCVSLKSDTGSGALKTRLQVFRFRTSVQINEGGLHSSSSCIHLQVFFFVPLSCGPGPVSAQSSRNTSPSCCTSKESKHTNYREI
ncbi:hypothetical protein AMECASPLE_034560 [Ameca splendens]|uniref:Secreted protein n=1 Tax=Ameca splendens TaxID=208324 RepID=A0ABV1ADJ6_9TELE